MEATMYGWAGKIVRVDLNEKRVSTTDIEQYCRDFIGGIGIAEKIYWDEGHPDKDAFHPDNPLIFMTGPLAATAAPAAPRWIVCGKSPLMYPETFYSGSMSGFFGAELKMAGFDGIVITGKAESPVYISIHDEKVEIKDARHLWGTTNSSVQDARTESGRRYGKTAQHRPGRGKRLPHRDYSDRRCRERVTRVWLSDGRKKPEGNSCGRNRENTGGGCGGNTAHTHQD